MVRITTQANQSPISPYLSDDSHWEDIEDIENQPRPSTPPGSVRMGITSPRKRRIAYRPAYVASPSRKIPPIPPSPRKLKSRHTIIEREEILDGAVQGASFTFRYFLDIFIIAIRLLRWPLALLLFCWLLAFTTSHITHTLRAALQPLCFLPGLSGSRMCEMPRQVSDATESKKTRWADYPKMIDVQSATFEHLLDESVSGSGLSVEIKKAEMATADLVTLVRVSDLKSRDVLSELLAEFVGDAKRAGRDLQRLSSKVGGAVDNVMAVNDYALHQIEATRAERPGILVRYGLVPWGKSQDTNEVIVHTFEEAMAVASASLHRLILEAEIVLADLEKLEERLSSIHEVVAREDLTLSAARAELLADLWTILGGNRGRLRNFDENLRLLKNLDLYRKKAFAHVSVALQVLKAMSSDMEDIRERVSAPELAGSKIPVEVHMKSISAGLQRLRDGRVRARRLEEDVIRRVLGIPSDSDEE